MNQLWVEKWRPQDINSCILPDRLKKTFKEMVNSGELHNLLLYGGPGCGKTTVARALCQELDSDYIMINCSEDGNIDTLRTKIRQFASTVSLGGGKKVVILDEFDYSNPNSTQPALRGFIEEFESNCRFILTCNYKNRIIEPIHSRCTGIDFRLSKNEKTQMAGKFFERIQLILKEEGIEVEEEKVLAELILKYFPDFRRIINELQRYSVGGKIDTGILVNLNEEKISTLIKCIQEKDFRGARKWVVENLDNDQNHAFRLLYDHLIPKLDPSSIPSTILTLAEYGYRSAFVVDQEINMVACIVEIMSEATFK